MRTSNQIRSLHFVGTSRVVVFYLSDEGSLIGSHVFRRSDWEAVYDELLGNELVVHCDNDLVRSLQAYLWAFGVNPVVYH